MSDSFIHRGASLALACGLALGVLTPGCFDVDRVGGPVLGYENDPDACDDGLDNDRDGMIDCRDPSCIGASLCGVIIIEGMPPEPENTFAKCIDRIDNDQDGNWDCGDRNCQAIQELCCVTEFSDVVCSDGVDNDENGFRDCGDFSCRNNPFVSACDFEMVCDDGRDNDEDDETDCDDSDCAGVAGCPPLPDPEPEDTIAKCSDGVDNDRNGFRDCGDFSCSMAADPAVRTFCAERLENTVERCSDGVDNDGNGFTDCNDFSCSRSTVPDLMELCTPEMPAPEEDSFDACKNGLDDDGDGFPDCADFSCRDSRQERMIDGMLVVASPCQESITVADPETDPFTAISEAIDRCANSVDEDQDGFTDCDDWDCQWNPLLRPGPEVTIPAGRPAEEGYCQGWRFDPRTRTWAFDPNAFGIRPLLCR